MAKRLLYARSNKAARLIRTWLDDYLCKLKPGTVAPLILCGIVFGALCMHKPPAVGGRNVHSSSGPVHAACQPGAPAASAAHLPAPPGELIGGPYHEKWQTAQSAYNILVPDGGGGSGYRLKTIVNQ